MAHKWTVVPGVIYHGKSGWRRVSSVVGDMIYYKNQFERAGECDLESFKRWRRRAKARKARNLQPKEFHLEPIRRQGNRKRGGPVGNDVARGAQSSANEGAGRPRHSRPDGVTAELPLVP